MYVIIRQRKECKIQGELSSENTFRLQDCSNVSVEVSTKIRVSQGRVTWISTSSPKSSPALPPICCNVFTTPPLREAGGLALPPHQTRKRHRGEMTGHSGRPRDYIVSWDVPGTAQPFSNYLRGPGNRSFSVHSIAVVGGTVPAHPSPPPPPKDLPTS